MQESGSRASGAQEVARSNEPRNDPSQPRAFGACMTEERVPLAQIICSFQKPSKSLILKWWPETGSEPLWSIRICNLHILNSDENAESTRICDGARDLEYATVPVIWAAAFAA
jgi:hypothetical protein